MCGTWQYYNLDTKVFSFLYVTILNTEEVNILQFVTEWPFNITGVTQLEAQTYNFDCNAASPDHVGFIWVFLQ